MEMISVGLYEDLELSDFSISPHLIDEEDLANPSQLTEMLRSFELLESLLRLLELLETECGIYLRLSLDKGARS